MRETRQAENPGLTGGRRQQRKTVRARFVIITFFDSE